MYCRIDLQHVYTCTLPVELLLTLVMSLSHCTAVIRWQDCLQLIGQNDCQSLLTNRRQCGLTSQLLQQYDSGAEIQCLWLELKGPDRVVKSRRLNDRACCFWMLNMLTVSNLFWACELMTYKLTATTHANIDAAAFAAFILIMMWWWLLPYSELSCHAMSDKLCLSSYLHIVGT